jgi:8-oxo-dGTP pyrophosphatase MutT (NUDIX family)
MNGGFDSFSGFLVSQLRNALPGPQAQMSMAPVNRIPESLVPPPNTDARISSVLLLVYPQNAQPNFVLIERNTYDGVHSGQMGLPGGKKEAHDPDLQSTALRETQEEIGVQPHQVQLIGSLTPLFIPVSKFLVHPFVGILQETPVFKPDPREVASVFSVHPEWLLQPANRSISKVNLGNGLSRQVPAFVLHEKIIWGATAMILGEFSALIHPFYANKFN